jgi:cytochrome c peroxidase
MHDGSIGSIDEMIKIMAKHQLGEELKDGDVVAIKEFLGSLTAKKLKF